MAISQHQLHLNNCIFLAVKAASPWIGLSDDRLHCTQSENFSERGEKKTDIGNRTSAI